MHKYTREECIGRGGFGKVFRGCLIATGAIVAMKKLTGASAIRGSDHGADPSALREIRVLKEISHPNVIGLVDAFVHNSKLWIVYEFAPQDLGRTLRDPTVTRSPAHIKAWAKMMLEGLAYLHENFFLHRDIKPANLLISPDGDLKLGDFGLCRTFGSPSSYPMTPEVVTRWYRAPELLFGAKIYTPAIDVWSAGCIMAEMFTGAPLFDGGSDIDQISKITFTLGNIDVRRWPGVDELDGYIEFTHTQTPKVSSLRDRLKGVPLDAVELIEQMLQYNPAVRPDARKCLSNVYFRNMPQPTPAAALPMSVLRNDA